MLNMGSHVGQVKWFDPKKGYGFILGPQGQDVFVHYSQIDGDGFKSLKDGESVAYELNQGDKGFQARNVSRVDIHVNAPEMGVNPLSMSTSMGSKAPTAKPPKADAI